MRVGILSVALLSVVSACGTGSSPDTATEAGTCESVAGKTYATTLVEDCSSQRQASAGAMAFYADGGVIFGTIAASCTYTQTGCALSVLCDSGRFDCSAEFTDKDSFSGNCSTTAGSCNQVSWSGFR
jgi:hypothetical protein